LFQLWFVCLAIAVVVDTFIKPPAKAAVSAFAALLSPEGGQVACKITQNSAWTGELRTTTSGSFQGRRTTVLVCQSKFSFLILEMGCRAQWVLDIRKRNLASPLRASVGVPLKTGDEALDAAVVMQGDDEAAIRQWARTAQVQPKILSLFQVCGITSLTTVTGRSGEPVLRAQRNRFRPRFFPPAHAVGILNDLAGLATTAEASAHA